LQSASIIAPENFPLLSKHNKLCNLAFYYPFIFCAVPPRRSGFVIPPASQPVRPQRGLPVLRASAAPPPLLKHKGRVLAAGAARSLIPINFNLYGFNH